MDTFTNPVLTSKAATDDYNNIVAQHGQILSDMQQQAMRVENFNRNQSLQKAQTDAQRMAERKSQMEMDQKMRELEIKRLALTS